MLKNHSDIKIVEFTCSLTNEVIQHQIDPSFVGHHEKYPFPYIFNHKDIKSNQTIFTVLYLDENYHLVEHHSKYLDSSGKMQIIQEILQLEKDYKRLHQKYKRNIEDLKNKIFSLQNIEELSLNPNNNNQEKK